MDKHKRPSGGIGGCRALSYLGGSVDPLLHGDDDPIGGYRGAALLGRLHGTTCRLYHHPTQRDGVVRITKM
jgi:hypothetical protein